MAADLTTPASTNSGPVRHPLQPASRLAPGSLGASVDLRILSIITPEQKASLDAAVQTRRAQARQLEENVRAARKALTDAGITGKVEEKLIRDKAKAVGDAEAELALFRAKTLAQMQPPLSPEQLEKMQQPLRVNNANPSESRRIVPVVPPSRARNEPENKP